MLFTQLYKRDKIGTIIFFGNTTNAAICSQIAVVCTPSSPAKVTQLEDGTFRIHKQVLRLDVSVTHALGMDVGKATEQLVHVNLRRKDHQIKFQLGTLYANVAGGKNAKPYLHVYNGDDALGFVKVPSDPVYGLRDEIQHQVEVNLIFL